MYFVKTPKILKHFYSNETLINKDDVGNNKIIYLTFDDGPNENITEQILKTLNEFDVKATFFCLGMQMVKYPDLFLELKKNGHQVGNHTFTHIKGWDVSNYKYYKEILLTEQLTKNKLFRPPYGQIKQQQLKALKRKNYKVYLWDVMPGDFDEKITKETCLKNAIDNTENNTNIVFHDNLKSKEKMEYCIPRYLETMLNKGFEFKILDGIDFVG